MSKICGIAGPGLGNEDIKAVIDRMTGCMKHESDHRLDKWDGEFLGFGHLSIGAVNEHTQPIASGDGSKVIVFCGKIFGCEDQKKELLDLRHKFDYAENDAEYILHLYEEYGTSRFSGLNGIFSFCIWDVRKKELILVNDRYGMRPVYYHFDKNKRIFLFASELKAISSCRFYQKKTNWQSWNVFLRLGFLIDDDTFFKDVYFMPQAGILTFDLGRLRIKSYWDFKNLERKTKFDEPEDVEKACDLFKQAMQRRIMPGKKVTVLLSGGMDSSGISAALKNSGVSFDSYTTRKFIGRDEDKKSAEYVARVLGLKNIFCDLPENFLEQYEPLKNRLLDYQSHEHAWLLPMLSKIPSDIKINYDGLGFDFVCNTIMYTDSHARYREMLDTQRYEEFIKSWYYSRQGYYYLLWPIDEDKFNFRFLSKALRKEFSSESFVEKIKKQLENVHGSNAPYVFFHLATRARRSVAASVFHVVLNRMESFCPYLDNDLFDHLLSLPPAARKNKMLRSKILGRLYPELFNHDSCFHTKNINNFMESHDSYQLLKAKHLSRVSLDFMKTIRSDVFDPFYLYPRLIKDLIFSNLYLLSGNKGKRQGYYNRCHFGLTPQLYMLNSWLNSAGKD